MGDAQANDAAERLLAFSTEWCARRGLGDDLDDATKERPTKCQLARLLDVLYHASLRTEEGRYPRLAVMWMGRNSGAAQNLEVLTFEESKKLNEERSAQPHRDLSKTASMCESETVFLLVEPAGTGPLDFVAWGLADIRGNAQGKTCIAEKLDISQYPDVLTVHFSEPGRFYIRRNGKFEAEYPETDSLRPRPLGGLDGRFRGVSAHEADDQSEAKVGNLHLAKAREYLIELVVGRLAASGRGGALLWPGSGGTRLLGSSGTPIKGVGVDGKIRALIGVDSAKGFQPEAPYRFREIARLMSEIASVDGATEIMADDLKIVRYGAKIDTAEDYMEEVEAACDPQTYEWLKPLGTRHRSAAYWVVAEGSQCRSRSQEENPLALVVSADGDANALYWDDGRVVRRPVVYRRL